MNPEPRDQNKLMFTSLSTCHIETRIVSLVYMVSICCYNHGKVRDEGMHSVLLVSQFQLCSMSDTCRSIHLTVMLNCSTLLSLSNWLIQFECIDLECISL